MMTPRNGMARVLDLARWAPSGDNTQPWQFEVLDDMRLVVHGRDTRDHCVYDLDGHASQLAIGALIETMSIAASAFQWRIHVHRRLGLPDTQPTFEIEFQPDASIGADPLLRHIPWRSVQRRPLWTTPLLQADKQALADALGDGYELRFLEGWSARWRVARWHFHNAKIRLTTQEAYRVHADIIDWGKRFSTDRVPDQALGADRLSLLFMRWAMQDWRRIQWLNRFAAGTWLPRLQLDLLPSLLCAAHVLIVRRTAPVTVDDHVEAGRVVQRFWLTATAAGLQHQPGMTPLIFSRYVRESRAFSTSQESLRLAKGLYAEALSTVGPELDRIVWMGRLGRGAMAAARSVRKSGDALLLTRSDVHVADMTHHQHDGTTR